MSDVLANVEKIAAAYTAATVTAGERLGDELLLADPSYEDAHKLEEAGDAWQAAVAAFGEQFGEDWQARVVRMVFAELIEEGWLRPGPRCLVDE